MRKPFVLILAAACLALGLDDPSDEAAVSERMSRTRDVHGAAGPWAVAGYRIGERALKELKLPRHGFSLLVVHRAPAEVQYSCIADGLQAATGTSPGKLNLRVEKAAVDRLSTVVEDRESGRRLTFTLKPAFVRSILNVDHEHAEKEGRRVAKLKDDDVFSFTESKRAVDNDIAKDKYGKVKRNSNPSRRKN